MDINNYSPHKLFPVRSRSRAHCLARGRNFKIRNSKFSGGKFPIGIPLPPSPFPRSAILRALLKIGGAVKTDLQGGEGARPLRPLRNFPYRFKHDGPHLVGRSFLHQTRRGQTILHYRFFRIRRRWRYPRRKFPGKLYVSRSTSVPFARVCSRGRTGADYRRNDWCGGHVARGTGDDRRSVAVDETTTTTTTTIATTTTP